MAQIKSAFGFDESTKQIEKLDDDYAEVVSDINDNPWLSEPIRLQRIKKEQDKYEIKRTQLIDRLKLDQTIVGKALEVYDKEKSFVKICFLNSLI